MLGVVEGDHHEPVYPRETTEKVDKRKECPECGKRLTNVPEHLKSVHWKVKPFSCPCCDYTSSFNRDLVKHARARHPDYPLDLINVEADVKPTVAQYCSIENENFERMSQSCSESGSEAKLASCPICMKLLTNVPEHVKAVHNKEKSYFCNECQYNTMFKGDLIKHEDSVHRKLKKSCPECGKSVANVHEHIRLVHKQEKNFKCNVCKYLCSKKSDMKKHTRNVHKMIDVV